MTDHKEIWLEPRCDKPGAWCQRAEDRMWCEDDVWGKCEDCEIKSVRYVLAEDKP